MLARGVTRTARGLSTQSALPHIYLGTMTFGWSQSSAKVDLAVASEMVKRFVFFGGKRIDTARIYAGGDTEPIVGKAISPARNWGVTIGSKAHPSQPDGLSEGGMRAQLNASLGALGCDSLDEFYLHQPDTETPLLDSLRCANALQKEGKIRTIGMSNYHASEMARAFTLCEEHGLAKPTVYQGLYNPLNRAIENELLPVLRAHNCSFVAYNPLAAGLLTGRHTSLSDVQEGRFKDNPNYRARHCLALVPSAPPRAQPGRAWPATPFGRARAPRARPRARSAPLLHGAQLCGAREHSAHVRGGRHLDGRGLLPLASPPLGPRPHRRPPHWRLLARATRAKSRRLQRRGDGGRVADGGARGDRGRVGDHPQGEHPEAHVPGGSCYCWTVTPRSRFPTGTLVGAHPQRPLALVLSHSPLSSTPSPHPRAQEAFAYWRSYSSDMPERDSLDPGASYSAAKK